MQSPEHWTPLSSARPVSTENWIRLDARQRLGNPATFDDRVSPTLHIIASLYENEARGRNPNPSPTAQRGSPAGIEATTTQQYRSLSVWLYRCSLRSSVSFGVTTNPTTEWISRQIIEAFPWDSSPRYLIRDRDTAYGVVFRQR